MGAVKGEVLNKPSYFFDETQLTPSETINLVDQIQGAYRNQLNRTATFDEIAPLLRQTTPVNISQLETNLNQSPEGRQYDIQIVNRVPISELTTIAQNAQKSGASIAEIRSLMDSYQIPADKQNTIISTILPAIQ